MLKVKEHFEFKKAKGWIWIVKHPEHDTSASLTLEINKTWQSVSVHWRKTSRGFLQILHKHQLGLKDELSTFWWLQVRGHFQL